MNLSDDLSSSHSKEHLRRLSKVKIKEPLLVERFISYDLYQKAESLLAYFPLAYEVDITLLLHKAMDDKKQLYLPKVMNQSMMTFFEVRNLTEDLSIGAYGMLEPLSSLPVWHPSQKPTIMLAPALATTISGYRLGHGGGFYDRFLASVATDTLDTIAVVDKTFSQCVFPTEVHDIPLHYILTQQQLIQSIL
ncbi:5-formyltetrahydrofolate cyclo-ligase [Entomospira entomophila]|uniref:5-formyltetrahydrofolate cyclo-ligase n=1 Tax=Entomospira entomophila TaxID=2719988 RepID=A0A968G9B9_9SPIO|nr:5-formyltetrahydrofolate cyclo-ligase [Entomospira entomophilus]NIZ40932.1 5-formyltetrahydrofolate cyclo-ligase [Entomospira entomophilus]WDI35145.1 5-formyltetrahydrofolate cyclo-ligase [Entomospira entomophilus]